MLEPQMLEPQPELPLPLVLPLVLLLQRACQTPAKRRRCSGAGCRAPSEGDGDDGLAGAAALLRLVDECVYAAHHLHETVNACSWAATRATS